MNRCVLGVDEAVILMVLLSEHLYACFYAPVPFPGCGCTKSNP